MYFGSKELFAIECYSEAPLGEQAQYVWGRMCVWAGGQKIGDIDDLNILDATEGHFEELPKILNELDDRHLAALPDLEAFTFLDSRLFLDWGQPDEQVKRDADRYSRFMFLTNWGEQFDGIKAFLLRDGSDCRILYRLDNNLVGSATVKESYLRNAIVSFLGWMKEQRSKQRLI